LRYVVQSTTLILVGSNATGENPPVSPTAAGKIDFVLGCATLIYGGK